MAIIEQKSIIYFKELLEVEISEYWLSHYRLNVKSINRKQKSISDSMRQSIIINAIVPLAYFYGKTKNKDNFAWLILLLKEAKFESNKITGLMKHPYFEKESAFDSQALIFLYKNYCYKKKCLQCEIGKEILGK